MTGGDRQDGVDLLCLFSLLGRSVAGGDGDGGDGDGDDDGCGGLVAGVDEGGID